MGIESLGGNPDWSRSISSNEYLVRSTLRAMYNGDGGLSHSWDMIVCDKAVVASRLVRWSLDHSGEWVFMIAWWMCVIGLVIADGMNIWSTLGIRLSTVSPVGERGPCAGASRLHSPALGTGVPTQRRVDSTATAGACPASRPDTNVLRVALVISFTCGSSCLSLVDAPALPL